MAVEVTVGGTRCKGPVTQNQSALLAASLCPPWVSFSESDPNYVTQPRMPPAAPHSPCPYKEPAVKQCNCYYGALHLDFAAGATWWKASEPFQESSSKRK